MQTSTEKIDYVTPVQGLNLDVVKVRGYHCVVTSGKYRGGEHVVLIRPETLLEGRYHSFLQGSKIRLKYRTSSNGKYGYVIKQCTIHGLRSEALVINIPNRVKNYTIGMCLDKVLHAFFYQRRNKKQPKGGV
jgi:hypothetical protein